MICEIRELKIVNGKIDYAQGAQPCEKEATSKDSSSADQLVQCLGRLAQVVALCGLGVSPKKLHYVAWASRPGSCAMWLGRLAQEVALRGLGVSPKYRLHGGDARAARQYPFGSFRESGYFRSGSSYRA